MKILALEPHLKKAVGLKVSAMLLKRDSNTGTFLEILRTS